MGKRVVTYLAVFLITAYLFLMYNEPALTAILVLECLYPFLSFLYLKWIRGRVSAGLHKVPAMGNKNSRIRISIWIKNTSIFWSVKYKAEVRVGSSFLQRQEKKVLSGNLEGKSRKIQSYYFTSSYCGRVAVSMESLRIYDFLGIFYHKIKLGERSTVGIMPEFELIPLEITRRTREFLADADEYSVEKGGDDPAEIYRIREYRPRDSVHDIHWKLTAKEGELMVKEHGCPLGCVVLLWVDSAEKGASATGIDRMLERTASLSMTLAGEKCIHMAAWFEEKNARVVKYKVNSAESAYELVWRLLDIEPYEDREMAGIAYEDAFLGEHFSSIVVIDGQGNMKINGETQELLQL